MGAICGQNFHGFGGPAQIGHLTANNPIESNEGHKDSHHHHICHGPFAGLNHKELDYFILS